MVDVHVHQCWAQEFNMIRGKWNDHWVQEGGMLYRTRSVYCRNANTAILTGDEQFSRIKSRIDSCCYRVNVKLSGLIDLF